MGRIHLEYLGGQKTIFNCGGCETYLTNIENLASKLFQSGSGAAYLFRRVVNVEQYELSKKQMTTGPHMVRDIACKICKRKVGWMYEMAIPPSQKYKEGQFILECAEIHEVEGLSLDPDFQPHSSMRFSLVQPVRNATGTPRNTTDSTNTSLLYPQFQYRNTTSISDLAALINGLNSQISAQAFVDATTAVASANIARRSNIRLSLNRTSLNTSNMANTSNSTSSVTTNNSIPGRNSHFVPNSNASAQMARRSLRNVIALPLTNNSSGSGNSRLHPNSSARTRQVLQRRTPVYSRGSVSSSSSSASTTFSSFPDNLSEETNSPNARSSNATISSSSSNSLENEPTNQNSNNRHLSIHLNPSHSVDDNTPHDLRQMRSGRRISRSSGNR